VSEIVSVPDRNCMGFEIGGRKYDADRRGRITVERPDHARAIRRSLGESSRVVTGFGGARERRCPCGFTAFAFTRACPRCGRDLTVAA
jgi:hypothetical protein